MHQSGSFLCRFFLRVVTFLTCSAMDFSCVVLHGTGSSPCLDSTSQLLARPCTVGGLTMNWRMRLQMRTIHARIVPVVAYVLVMPAWRFMRSSYSICSLPFLLLASSWREVSSLEEVSWLGALS